MEFKDWVPGRFDPSDQGKLGFQPELLTDPFCLFELVCNRGVPVRERIRCRVVEQRLGDKDLGDTPVRGDLAVDLKRVCVLCPEIRR